MIYSNYNSPSYALENVMDERLNFIECMNETVVYTGINEGVIGDVLDAIVGFFKKLIEVIEEIIRAIVDFVKSIFGKSDSGSSSGSSANSTLTTPEEKKEGITAAGKAKLKNATKKAKKKGGKVTLKWYDIDKVAKSYGEMHRGCGETFARAFAYIKELDEASDKLAGKKLSPSQISAGFSAALQDMEHFPYNPKVYSELKEKKQLIIGSSQGKLVFPSVLQDKWANTDEYMKTYSGTIADRTNAVDVLKALNFDGAKLTNYLNQVKKCMEDQKAASKEMKSLIEKIQKGVDATSGKGAYKEVQKGNSMNKAEAEDIVNKSREYLKGILGIAKTMGNIVKDTVSLSRYFLNNITTNKFTVAVDVALGGEED